MNQYIRNVKKIGGYFLKKTHFCKYLVFQSLFNRVNHIDPNTPILGHLKPWSEKKLEFTQKSYFFLFVMACINLPIDFWTYTWVPIKPGCQELSKMVFIFVNSSNAKVPIRPKNVLITFSSDVIRTADEFPLPSPKI